MSLFDDDFYNTKVSRRSKRNMSVPFLSRRKRSLTQRSRSGSTFKVIAVSSISSAVTVMIIVSLFGWYSSDSSSSVVASSIVPTMAQSTDGNPYEQLIHVANEVRPAMVSIVNYQDESSTLNESALGSGVIFRKEGSKAYIVTNNHVIQDADQVKTVLSDGTTLAATVVGTDFISDIAVLSISSKNIDKIAQLGNSDQLQLGETVMAIGNPLGFNGTMTSGIISYNNRLIPVSLNQDGTYDWEQNVIQTDAAINEGNSGGALVNLNGQVIGINTMKISDTGVEGLGFAIPINEVMKNVDLLIKNGKISRPYLGVYTTDFDNKNAYRLFDEQEKDYKKPELPKGVTEGIIVVEASGPAKEAGILADDIIVQLDQEKMASTLDLRKYLYNHKKVGDSLEITYYRDDVKKSATLQLQSKPD
ncbi:trypsin-like peptidase domain-containing protein [Paenibacillus sp. PK4536]|uniref:Peptidase Do n=1 Tax=Paenibacillus nuruki TaxID=1886670 RepID=A0A1E3L793_9BACL|nr:MULTISPECIES: trypsin-like peptidase domain-containing protein [Paenibacillus]ODP29471.1 Peptidase Do [Paenibacillus nuruki]TKJ88927.1 PDZ domain-containing protein [Paenibacillus sp. CFBP13512]WIM40348.1 trypsin-like peptidase domain-containing protein [Paenibacillus sp. PK4536]CAJ1317311.1 Peptidase Do [Paenibacillus nuruki]